MDTQKSLNWWKEKFDAALKPRPPKKREPSIYGSFNERLMAAGIDVTILFLLLNDPVQRMSAKLYATLDPQVVKSLVKPQDMQQFTHNLFSSGFLTLYFINFAVQLVLIGALIVTFQSLMHTTPGKWLLGLKITKADNETFPETWRLIVRYIGYIISSAPLLLGFIWVNFDPQRRAWHDRLAGTRVITTRPQGWYWTQFKKLFAGMKDKNG